MASLVSTLREVISSSLVTELVHATHTNALLLQQYFAQADKWSLRLRSGERLLSWFRSWWWLDACVCSDFFLSAVACCFVWCDSVVLAVGFRVV